MIFVFFLNSSIPPGSEVVVVHARDLDSSAPNNHVFYFLETGGRDDFAIDHVTGVVTVVGKLDRESVTNYSLHVMARDQGADPLYSYCTVYINVSDINDEPPRFREKHVTIPLSDGAFGYVYNMSAVDLDLDYQLKYSILWNESYGMSASLTMITSDQLSVIIISTAAAASSTLLSISLIFIWLFILFTAYTNSPRRILNCIAYWLKIICRMISMLSWTNFTEILLSFFLHFLELARYRL